MKTKLLTKQKVANSVKGVVSGSLHQMRAINTYKEMKEELAKFKQDVSFREYIGFEIAMQIFYNRYEKWLGNYR